MKQDKQNDCPYGSYILMRNSGNEPIDNVSVSAVKQKQSTEFKVMGEEWEWAHSEVNLAFQMTD